MRYMMRHKLFSIGRDYTITDDAGQPRFLVDGKVLSLGHKLIFTDLDGNELATIQQRLLTFRPTYEISHAGVELAEVKKRLTFFAEQFSIDVPGPDDYEVQGDVWNHEYGIYRDGQQVAQVSKQWFSLTDVYGVEVTPGEDDVLLLAATVVIDMINEDREHN